MYLFQTINVRIIQFRLFVKTISKIFKNLLFRFRDTDSI